MKWLLAWAVLFLAQSMETANANISVYPMTVILDQQSGGTLDIHSLSDETSYVKITIKRLVYAQESLTPIEQDIQLYKDGVFAVPNLVVLPAKGKRTIRFVSSAIPEQAERAYRVYIETVPPVKEQNNQLDKSTPQTSLAVNIIWGALLFIPPQERTVSMQYIPATGMLKNAGNTFLRVVNVSVCSRESACHTEKLDIPPLPPSGQFNFHRLFAARSSIKEITLTYEDRSSKKLHELKITL